MKKTFAYPIIFMAILTALFTFTLAFLNYSTAERVDFNEKIDLNKKILYVFDIDADTDDPQEIDRIFDENIEETKTDGGPSIYTLKPDDQVLGYAFPVRGAGLWGSILGYVGITDDYSEIIGLDFISHSETPGLGGRIEDEPYKEQFRGLELTDDGDEYIVYRPESGANVDSISGATLTAKSVRNILNEDIKEFIEKWEGE